MDRFDLKTSLPPAYAPFPHEIELIIPGYSAEAPKGVVTFSPQPITASEWFETFLTRVCDAIGTRKVDVVRIADGEFHFWLGAQPPSPRLSFAMRVRGYLAYLRSRLWGGFRAQTPGRYVSGAYSREEWRVGRQRYDAFISNDGADRVFAMALHYTARSSFCERYFPAFRNRITTLGVRLTTSNYVPFYFVYALVRSPQFLRSLRGKHVLIVTHASDEKKGKIQEYLSSLGVATVTWCAISSERSLYDDISLAESAMDADVCFVGAGIGKVNVFDQLSDLKCPCIDIGYVLEVWADPTAAGSRPFLTPDTTP